MEKTKENEMAIEMMKGCMGSWESRCACHSTRALSKKQV